MAVMKKIQYIIIGLAGILCVIPSCTKLKSTSYDQIVTSQFKPTEQDVASLVGAAYVNWRLVLNDWNGVFRAQEVSADQVVIPARPNGWVDGGIYRRIHEHRWTADED